MLGLPQPSSVFCLSPVTDLAGQPESRRTNKRKDAMFDAGGFGIAMSCDLVMASSRASFEWAYPKTGLTGAESSTFLLPRLVGLRRAMELMLLNPRLTAHKAVDLGLATAVVPAETFDADVLATARTIAAGRRSLG